MLLLDRGLCWPEVLCACQAAGWHFLVRCQGQTRFRTADGTVSAVRDLLTTVDTWLGRGEAFKKAGWLRCNVVAVRRTTGKEDWLLLTDLPPTLQRTAQYRARMWIEERFRDDKSSGFGWQHRRVCDPKHAQRVLVLLQVRWCSP